MIMKKQYVEPSMKPFYVDATVLIVVGSKQIESGGSNTNPDAPKEAESGLMPSIEDDEE